MFRRCGDGLRMDGALQLAPCFGRVPTLGTSLVTACFPTVAPATHESSGVRAWPGCTDRRGAARTAADFARQASPVRPACFATGRGGITATTGAILAACRWLYNKALLDHDSPAAGGQPRGRWQAAPSPVGPGVLRGRPSLFDGPTQWPCVRREEAEGCPPFDVSRPEGWGRGLGAGSPAPRPRGWRPAAWAAARDGTGGPGAPRGRQAWAAGRLGRALRLWPRDPPPSSRGRGSVQSRALGGGVCRPAQHGVAATHALRA